jgi:peptidoglycan/LPS O-acetylase OafA/YrhL
MIANLVFPPGHLCHVPTLDIPLWSLGCEIVFYALAPFLFRAPGWVLCVLALASARAYLSPLVNEWLYGAPTICFFWVWMLGFMLHSRRTPALVLVTAASAGLLWNHPLIRYSQASIVAQYLGTLALIVSPWLPRLGRPVDYLGAISFPLYLVHFPVIIYLFDTMRVTDVTVLVLAVIFVTLLFHHLVDAPGRRLLSYLFPAPRKGS